MSESFDAYWERLCRATPQLRNPDAKMTISVVAFRKAIQKSFKAGGSDIEALSAFDKIFGNGLFNK